MDERKLVLTGMGMVSPVGYNAAQTCAALRAGIAMFRELPGIVDSYGNPIIAAPLPDLGPDVPLTEKLTVSTWRAIVEALDVVQPRSKSKLLVAIVSAEKERSGYPLNIEWLKAALLDRWSHSGEVSFGVYALGHAGAAAAIKDLSKHLGQSQGSVALLVAADSLITLPTLAYLDSAGRLKSYTRPRGAIPGEAAVALVIESVYDLSQRGIIPYCSIDGAGFAVEPVPVNSSEPCLGEGLTHAVYSALDAAGCDKRNIKEVYCDLNGEEYRTHEWMLTLCRALEEPFLVHPADCIGDVGAASLPLLVAMAGMALQRGYAVNDRVLAWASSDFGSRGAICVRTV